MLCSGASAEKQRGTIGPQFKEGKKVLHGASPRSDWRLGRHERGGRSGRFLCNRGRSRPRSERRWSPAVWSTVNRPSAPHQRKVAIETPKAIAASPIPTNLFVKLD